MTAPAAGTAAPAALIATVRRFQRSFSAGRSVLRQVRSAPFEASAIVCWSCLLASRRIGFDSRHASFGERADLFGDVMAALRQFLGELRVGQAVDERANGLGDVVGRSCRAGRHVVLLWVRPVAGCTKYATADRNRPIGRFGRVRRPKPILRPHDRDGRGRLPERWAASGAEARAARRARWPGGRHAPRPWPARVRQGGVRR